MSIVESNPPSFKLRDGQYPTFVTGLNCPVYVEQREVRQFPVNCRKLSNGRPEVRPLGSCGAFQYLEGVIVTGPLALVLFEEIRGGHLAADTILEVIV